MLGSTIFLFFGQLSSVNFLFQPQHVFHTLFLVLSQYFQRLLNIVIPWSGTARPRIVMLKIRPFLQLLRVINWRFRFVSAC